MATGLPADRNQPIHIEADKAVLDENEGVSVYEGNVRLRQGTLRLAGSRMTVQLRNNEVHRVILTGRPASYRQRFEADDVDQQAEAERMEYLALEQRMIMQGNVRIWQEGKDEFSSATVELDLQANTLQAGGDDPDGRVHIILQPRPLTEEDVDVDTSP